MGYHLYYFYDNDDQLMRALANFFMEGLRKREHCTWIPREGIPVHMAINMLKRYIPDIEDYLLTDQMFIAEFEHWYLDENGKFDKTTLLEKWKKKYQEVMAKGYLMMRVAGDGSDAVQKHWQELIDYEDAVNFDIAESNIIAVCSYNGKTLKPSEIHAVLSTHLCSLVASAEVVD